MPPPKDPAEMLFEPTGDLLKDYSAYCEIEDKSERDDLLDAICAEEIPDAPGKHRTKVVVRNLDYCLNKRDSIPLANAIPHCFDLTTVEFTSCGLTEHSYKLFVEALYKSASVTSFIVDFNPQGLFKDPTVSKRDKNEVMIYPSQYRGAHLKHAEPEVKDDKKGKIDAKKTTQIQQVKDDNSASDKPPIQLPTGWHSILFTGIQHLSLRGNGITDQQVTQICSLLEGHNELLFISLWGNNISNAGANALAHALKCNRRLTALNLGHNKIEDEGAIALAECFLTRDVTNDEALRVRSKLFPNQIELPQYPSFAELHALTAQPIDDKKDPKKKEAPKQKKGEGPVERHKTEFDKDCIRIDDGHLRIPANYTLWALNLSQNSGITDASLRRFAEVLSTREPELFSEAPPPPYCPIIALEKLELENSGLDEELRANIQNILRSNAETRANDNSKNL